MEALDGDSMKSFFKEMQQQFMAELDFRKEVANLNEIRGSTGPTYEGCVECGSIDRLIPDPPVHSGCNPRDDRFHRFKKNRLHASYGGRDLSATTIASVICMPSGAC